MNNSKAMRFLVMFLAVLMVVGCLPMTALAVETETEGEVVTATVSFDVNGGVGEYEDQVVTVGEKVTKPEQNPTLESYEFAYWTANLEEKAAWNFEADVVTEDMTLYAVWTAPVAAIDDAENKDGVIYEDG